MEIINIVPGKRAILGANPTSVHSALPFRRFGSCHVVLDLLLTELSHWSVWVTWEDTLPLLVRASNARTL